MAGKINTLFDYIKTLCESDLDRVINFVLGIVSACQQTYMLTTNTLMADFHYSCPI